MVNADLKDFWKKRDPHLLLTCISTDTCVISVAPSAYFVDYL